MSKKEKKSSNIVSTPNNNSQELTIHYEILFTDNMKLRERLNELTGENNVLREMVKNKDITIEELQKENDKLKKRIQELEEKVKRLDLENIELKQKVDSLTNDRLKQKIIIAIQDINGLHKLEKTIKHKKYIASLIELRNNRNGCSHYIFNGENKQDKQNVVQYKEKILIDKLNNPMLKEIIEEIDYEYEEGFIDTIKNELSEMISSDIEEPTDFEKKMINRFWS